MKRRPCNQCLARELARERKARIEMAEFMRFGRRFMAQVMEQAIKNMPREMVN